MATNPRNSPEEVMATILLELNADGGDIESFIYCIKCTQKKPLQTFEWERKGWNEIEGWNQTLSLWVWLPSYVLIPRHKYEENMCLGREWSMSMPECLLRDEHSYKLAIEGAILVAVADLQEEEKERILRFSNEIIKQVWTL